MPFEKAQLDKFLNRKVKIVSEERRCRSYVGTLKKVDHQMNLVMEDTYEVETTSQHDDNHPVGLLLLRGDTIISVRDLTQFPHRRSPCANELPVIQDLELPPKKAQTLINIPQQSSEESASTSRKTVTTVQKHAVGQYSEDGDVPPEQAASTSQQVTSTPQICSLPSTSTAMPSTSDCSLEVQTSSVALSIPHTSQSASQLSGSEPSASTSRPSASTSHASIVTKQASPKRRFKKRMQKTRARRPTQEPVRISTGMLYHIRGVFGQPRAVISPFGPTQASGSGSSNTPRPSESHAYVPTAGPTTFPPPLIIRGRLPRMGAPPLRVIRDIPTMMRRYPLPVVREGIPTLVQYSGDASSGSRPPIIPQGSRLLPCGRCGMQIRMSYPLPPDQEPSTSTRRHFTLVPHVIRHSFPFFSEAAPTASTSQQEPPSSQQEPPASEGLPMQQQQSAPEHSPTPQLPTSPQVSPLPQRLPTPPPSTSGFEDQE